MTTTTTADDVIPALRGVLHAWAFWFAVVAGSVLIALAPGGTARIAAGVYAIGLCALFAGSALYHRWRWDVRWRPLLRRIDHSTIFVFIAASYTPIALLVLSGPLRIVVLGTVWAGALAGVVFSVVWIGAPRWLVAGLPVTPLTLLAAGGVLYSAGAVVYALKRPNLAPRVFGFHELFHAFVIGAAVSHFVAMAGWVF